MWAHKNLKYLISLFYFCGTLAFAQSAVSPPAETLEELVLRLHDKGLTTDEILKQIYNNYSERNLPPGAENYATAPAPSMWVKLNSSPQGGNAKQIVENILLKAGQSLSSQEREKLKNESDFKDCRGNYPGFDRAFYAVLHEHMQLDESLALKDVPTDSTAFKSCLALGKRVAQAENPKEKKKMTEVLDQSLALLEKREKNPEQSLLARAINKANFILKPLLKHGGEGCQM